MDDARRVADFRSLPPLERVGYWRSGDEPDLPDPADFVDPEWDETERECVLRYLEAAYCVFACAGPSWCRLGCEGIPHDIGTADYTDGRWIFPEGLLHYVRTHALKPPEPFLEHVRAISYEMPELPTIDFDD